MRLSLLFFLLLFVASLKSFGQNDTEFWFAAPEVDSVRANGLFDRPILLRLTSASTAAFVTIDQPANNGFTPVSVTIPANSTTTVDLTNWINVIENTVPNAIQNKGLHIVSSSEITAYYEVQSLTCRCNPELFAFKGRNAIGNQFYIPSQLTWAIDTVRHPNARAAFDIVATENNTSITITPSKPLIGRPASIPFNITLNKGQTFSCQALYHNGANLLNGSTVSSDKPVAVTTKEDLLFTDGDCADLAGDQLIPTSVIGSEYAVVRGNLAVRDKVVILAVSSNTLVYLNGNALPVATLNAGQSYEADLTSSPSLYIKSSKNVYVLHYSGNTCEVGSAVIPKLNCTGSNSVSIVRSDADGAFVFLVTKNGNQGSFEVNGNGGVIVAADFQPLAGTAGAYVFCKREVSSFMALDAATTFANSSGKFQLGFLNGSSFYGGCMYGYFSDYKKSNVTSSRGEICLGDSLQLKAFGGVKYVWTPSIGLSNSNIANPNASPSVTTTYKVVITDADGCVDSAFTEVNVSTCNVPPNNGCSKVLQANYGGDASDIAYDIVDAGHGQYYMVGNTNSFGAGGTDILVIKMDAAKNILWSKTYGVAGNETIRKATASPGGGLLITGQTTSFSNPRGDILCMKIDTVGNLVWMRSFGVGSPNGDLGSEIIQTADGGYAVTGILDVAGNVADGVVIKLNASANIVWSKRYHSGVGEDGSGLIETGTKLVVTSDIEYRSGNDYGVNITEFQTSNGNVLLSKNIISPTKGIFRPLIFKDGLNGYWLSGHLIEGSDYNQMEQVILKLSSSYTVSKTYKIVRSPLTNFYFTGFAPLKSGGFITCASEPNAAGGKGHIYKINSNGTTAFSKQISTGGKNSLNALSVIGDKVFTVGADNSSGDDNFYLAEFDTSGNSQSLCNVDTSFISIQNHVFNVSDFTWSSIVDQSFNNYVQTLTVSNQAVISNTICALSNAAGDFSFLQDDCNPLKLKFFGSDSSVGLNWDFGDGTIINGLQNPEHVYTKAGTYKVSFSYSGPCPLSVAKNTAVGILFADIINNNDTSVCENNSLQLSADSATSYCWTPSTYLNNTAIKNPVARPLRNITYRLTSKITSKNLVANGDFSKGNTSFISSYTYSATGVPQGVYYVDKSPNPWHPAMPFCVDHTSGSGNMLLVNGATNPGQVVWQQTIKVSPNSSYEFSVWAQNITTLNPSKLQFSINDIPLGAIFKVNDNFCLWEQFLIGWSSGNNTSAKISVLNMNEDFSGNDFALDDISFSTIDYRTDSLKIIIDKPAVVANNDTAICANTTLQMQANGAVTYSWLPTRGLSDSTAPNPIATIKNTAVQYIVTGKNLNGCTASDTVNIGFLPTPIINVSPDTTICGAGNVQLNASGGIKYQWTPINNLSNATVSNPIAFTTADTRYRISVTDANGCIASDSVNITVLPNLNVTVTNDTVVCAGSSIQLQAAGGASYQWLPAITLNNNSLPNPVATPFANTTYTVTVTRTDGCVGTKSVNIGVLPLPSIKTTNDTTICKVANIQLNASGGSLYQWSPTTGLNVTNVANPIATIQSTIKYFVKVTNANNCSSIDSVLLTLRPPPQFGVVLPDSPVCSGASVQLKAYGGDRYEWFPANGLSDPAIAEPRAVLQSSRTYNVKITESICNEQAIFNVPIFVRDMPFVGITKSNDINCNTPSAVLTGNIIANRYLWTPSASVSNPYIFNPVVTPLTNTVYTLTIVDTAGCISKGSIEVNVVNNNDFRLYQMPTAFTPGTDGKNDCFGITKWGPATIVYFTIFNRWGQQVFNGTGSKTCWDGMFNGQPQPGGNYVYKLKVQTICGIVERSGNVVLIR